MAHGEKRAWIDAVVGLVVPAVYIAVLLSRSSGAGLTHVPYTRSLLIAVGAAIVLNIVVNMVTGAGAGRTDERDKAIRHRGEAIAFYVMSICAVGPLVLAMAEASHFWIANALYLSFVLASIGSALVKIVAYRRGM